MIGSNAINRPRLPERWHAGPISFLWPRSCRPSAYKSRCSQVDAKPERPGPSADQPRRPERRQQQQPPAAKERRQDERPQEAGTPQRSLREKLRAHWLLASVAAVLVLVALAGSIAYWLAVRDYET